MMRGLKLLALSCALLAFSCGKDDEEDKTSKVTAADLVGSWGSSCFNFNGFDETVTMTYDAEGNYSIAIKYYPEDKSAELSSRCVAAGLLFTQVEKGTISLGEDIGDGVTEMDLSSAGRSVAITATTAGSTASSSLGGLSVVSYLCYKASKALTDAGSTLTTSYATAAAWTAETETVLWKTDADSNPEIADACGAGILQPRFVATQINSAGKLLGSDVTDLTKGQTKEDRIVTINALLPLTKQ